MKQPNFRDKQLGHNIRDIRLKKGMTLEEFCNEFEDPKPSPSIISRWERGVSTPNPKRLKRLSELDGIEISDLYKSGMDFFEGQIEKLSNTYQENRPEIKHDISQSYNFFRLGHKYLSFARETDNTLLTEYEGLLWLIGQSLDPKAHRASSNSYITIRNDIMRQLDRLHMLTTYPAFIADAKNKLDEAMGIKEPTSNTVTDIMENAKDELLNNGSVSNRTVKYFCKLFNCEEDFAIEFLNNKRRLTSTDNFED